MIEIAEEIGSEVPPFENSTPTKDKKKGYFNIRAVTGGYVVHVENTDEDGLFDKEYVVTSKVKLIKLIKKILEE